MTARRREWLILAAILLLALALRLYRLGAESFWLDEIGHYRVATAPTLAALFLGVRAHVAAAPLDYLLLRLYTSLFHPQTAFAIRLPYALYGVLAIYLLYRLGRRLYGPAVGLAAAFALAVSAYHLYYSQEVRFYALSAVFGLLGLLTFTRALEQPSRRNLAAWGLATLLGLYTHYYLVFQLAVELLYLLALAARQRKTTQPLPVRPFLVTTGLSILLFLPWLLWASAGRLVSASVAPVPLGRPLLLFLASLGDLRLVLLLGAFILAGLLGGSSAWLLFGVGLLPVFAALAADSAFGYFYNTRQVIFSLPPLILAASAGAALFATVLIRRLAPENTHLTRFAWAGSLALAALFLWGNLAQLTWILQQLQKPDWKGAAAFALSQGAAPEDLAALDERDAQELAFNLYGPDSSRPPLLSTDTTSLDQFLQTNPNTWLILSDTVFAELQGQLPSELAPTGPGFYGLVLLRLPAE